MIVLIATAVAWTQASCMDWENPKLPEPARLKFTLTVNDGGVLKSASTVYEMGQRRIFVWLQPAVGRALFWTTRSYREGSAILLDLDLKGWLVALGDFTRLLEGTSTGVVRDGGEGSGLTTNRDGGLALGLKSIPAAIVELSGQGQAESPVDSRDKYARFEKRVVVDPKYYPRFIYYPPSAKFLGDGVPLLSSEFHEIQGRSAVEIVSLTIEVTRDPRMRFAEKMKPMPEWWLNRGGISSGVRL